MTKYPWWYNLWFLIWFLPAYFLFMGLYQHGVYEGIHTTFEEGSEYQAIVTGFDIKQIAAQTNGYIDLRFTTAENDTVEQRLALPVQMAQVLMDYNTIPISYYPESRHPILILPTRELQRNIIRVNLAVNLFGFLVTVIIAWRLTRSTRTKLKTGRTDLVIERVDRSEEEPEDSTGTGASGYGGSRSTGAGRGDKPDVAGRAEAHPDDHPGNPKRQ